MLQRPKPLRWVVLGLAPVLALASCGGTAGAAAACTGLPETPVISFAAYSTPREVYGKIIPAFTTKWKDEHDGQTVIFQESYGASTSQAANVVAGYEADIVALSLGPDLDEIAPTIEDGEVVNPHGMDPQTVLRFVRAVGGWSGKVVIVACEPGQVDEYGLGLSTALEAADDDGGSSSAIASIG